MKDAVGMEEGHAGRDVTRQVQQRSLQRSRHGHKNTATQARHYHVHNDMRRCQRCQTPRVWVNGLIVHIAHTGANLKTCDDLHRCSLTMFGS